MSDGRWSDVDTDIDAAVDHFSRAVQIYRQSDMHADLIQRAGRKTANRPAILRTTLRHATDRTRKFRHVAVRAYDSFDPDDAEPAVRTAEKVAQGLAAAIADYRQAIDP